MPVDRLMVDESMDTGLVQGRWSHSSSSTDITETRVRKIQRLRFGERPRVVDLFAGCGGMSLGFQVAGFEIAGALEIEPLAVASHARNFHRSARSSLRKAHEKPRDIQKTSPRKFCLELGLGEVSNAIDVLIGGPPCQAFARVGRAKLREIAEHPEAFKNDGRADLYLRYLKYVREMQPLVVLMENVPDVINYGGHNIPEEMCEVLESLGYICRYTLLNSVFYGVPQMRERMFLIAYAGELNATIQFPQPARTHEIPRGYKGSRQVALKYLGDFFERGSRYMQAPAPAERLPPAVTAKEALDDLPRITLHLEGKLRRGARRFTEVLPYPDQVSANEYAKLMRAWPGFECSDGVSDHVIRYLPRDYAIFKRMKSGDQYPEAYRLAMRMLEEEVERRLPRQATEAERNLLRDKLRLSIVPPYDAGKFPNKWRKMEADQPARTLMAHLGKDGYSHIHYDSTQARTISVREAARLQSFPDGFRFEGTMNPAFRQIGNAVPPLMAKALAEVIRRALRGGT